MAKATNRIRLAAISNCNTSRSRSLTRLNGPRVSALGVDHVGPLDGALEPERSPLVRTSTGSQIPGVATAGTCGISLREGAGRWVRGSV